MPQLCFTELSSVSRTAKRGNLTLALSAKEQAGAAAIGLVEGMPFILGDDGSYDHHLNCFFRACPTLGVRSMNSLRAYARDILVWMRFLQERRDEYSTALAHLFHEHVASHSMTCGHPREVICEAIYS